MIDATSPLSRARDELRAIGITLKVMPGEFALHYRGHADPAAIVETLDEALEQGRELAGHAPKPIAPLGPMGSRKGNMIQHNIKVAERRGIRIRRR